jgi:hypothetical protein
VRRGFFVARAACAELRARPGLRSPRPAWIRHAGPARQPKPRRPGELCVVLHAGDAQRPNPTLCGVIWVLQHALDESFRSCRRCRTAARQRRGRQHRGRGAASSYRRMQVTDMWLSDRFLGTEPRSTDEIRASVRSYRPTTKPTRRDLRA